MLEIEIKSSSVPSTANDKPHGINAPSGWGRIFEGRFKKGAFIKKILKKGGLLFELLIEALHYYCFQNHHPSLKK